MAGNAAAAAPAREVLEKFGIGINDAVNGVFLPRVANGGVASVHAGGHTRDYYRTVNDALGAAQSRLQAEDALGYFGQQLQQGTLKVGR